MKKLLLIVIALILILAAAGAVFVFSIDWNEHKSKIASQFSELTGKRVVFEGPVTMSLFPSPYLTAEQVKIYSQDSKVKEPLAEIKSLVARLSLQPLLRGDFDVKRMSLVEPKIIFSNNTEQGFNWKSNLSEEQRQKLQEVQVKLDSVTIEKATLILDDQIRKIDWHLENLSAEVIAESVLGPYKIEGSYIKNNNPEGFSIAIGSLAENFATQLNLTLTNPATQTYVRFDGSVMPKNDAVNGNIIFESKKLMNFVTQNFKSFSFDQAYDLPLAFSTEVNANQQKIELANTVIKYGTTAAAGNIIIPRNVEGSMQDQGLDNATKKIELAFDLTDFDLVPAVSYLYNKFLEYDQAEKLFNIDPSLNVIADIKAVKANYRELELSDLALSVDIEPQKIVLNNFEAVFPGNSEFKIKGRIFSNKDQRPEYTADTVLSSDDFAALLRGLKIDPPMPVASIYKKFNGTAKLEGNLQDLKITPLDFVLDKSRISGDVALMRGEKMRMFLLLDGDSMNFDNYLAPLPQEIVNASMAERLKYRFEKLGWLNDLDLQFAMKIGLGIFESLPFENTQFEGKITDGKMQISKLDIASMAGAKIDLAGEVSGFGQEPQFANLKYQIKSPEFLPLLNKFGIKVAKLDPKIFKNFSSEGIMTGSPKRFAVKNAAKLEDVEITFGGVVDRRGAEAIYDGSLYIKSPDFLKLMTNLNIKYTPNVYSLGLLTLDGNFQGKMNKFVLNKLQLNVGQNAAQGNLDYDDTSGRIKMSGQLEINQIEAERFFYNPGSQASKEVVAFRKSEGDKAEFLAKPLFDAMKLNYDVYNEFDLNLELKIAKLLLREKLLTGNSLRLGLNNGIAKISGYKGQIYKGILSGDMELEMTTDPVLKTNLKVEKMQPDDSFWSGQKYGLSYGILDAAIKLETDASSVENMFKNLNGEVDFTVADGAIKGWNLENIAKDLSLRREGKGFPAVVKANLEQGKTAFLSFGGKINFLKGDYKIQDALLMGDNYRVGMQAQGNLLLWDVNSNQSLIFESLQKFPPIGFAFRGSLAAPMLEVDVAKIVKIYEDEQNEVISKQKEAEQKYREELQKKLNEQISMTKVLENRLNNEMRPKLKELMQKSGREETSKKLQLLSVEQDNIGKGIGEVVTLGMTPKYDDELISTVERRNNLLLKRLDKVEKNMTLENMEDIKFKINQVYNQVVKIYGESREQMNNYRAAYDGFNTRLNVIKSEYYLENDPQVILLSKTIQSMFLNLDSINNSMYRDYVQMQSSTNPKQLEDYIVKIGTLRNEAQERAKSLGAEVARFSEYGESKVKAEEAAYHNRKREAEIKRKLEENTGKISLPGAGKSMTVVRDIEDIEKSENRQGSDKLQVLDFSSEAGENVIVKQWDKNKEKKPSKNSNLLKPIEGEVSKATGVIVKK